MVWKQKHGILSKFKNLKLIISMGAGVDNVISDKTISSKIPICRIVDKQMAFSMSNYIIMAVLNYHRNWYDYDYAQKRNIGLNLKLMKEMLILEFLVLVIWEWMCKKIVLFRF